MDKSQDLVDFFIVGAPKCATTSLHRFLNKCDEIYLSQPKELNYFSCDELVNSNLYYKDKIVKSESEYREIYSGAKKGALKGDASVSYLFYKDVPRRIFKYNPNAKIIAVLRNPIERAHSHFLMDQRLGYCQKSFSEVFYNKEIYPLFFQQFFELSLYGKQLVEYFDVFSTNQILVLTDDDLRNKSQEVMNLVFDFLGLGYIDVIDKVGVNNSYKEPSNFFFKKLYALHSARRVTQKYLPRSIQNILKSVVFKSGSKPSIDSALFDELKVFYSQDVTLLSKTLNRDFNSEWNL